MATPPDRRKMRNNPVNGKKKKKRNGKRTGRATTVAGSTQRKPNPVAERAPLLYKKTMVDSGHGYKVAKWTKRASPKKALPLSKSVKKGSPRSYENLKKAKPLGRKRKNGIG